MNTSAPLPPDQLDELLSADLDGEFDAAARDFGMEPDEARERIGLTPGAKERQLSLAVARAAVADVEPLDDAVAARLRANATAGSSTSHPVDQLAARRRKRYRVLASAGAIAAAVALVLGIVASNNSSGDSSKTAAAPEAANANGAPKRSVATTVPVTVNLGEAKTADALAQRLSLSVPAYQKNDSAFSADTADATANEALVDGGANTVTPNLKELHGTSKSAPNCDTVAHDLTGVNEPPTLRATGKVADAPVLVYVFRSGNNEIVLMLNTKCQFVFRQARPAP